MSPISDISADDSKTLTPAKGEKSGPLSYEKNTKGGVVVVRPGRIHGAWERWLLIPEKKPALLPEETTIPQHVEHLICLPSSTLYAWPLWIASEGDGLDLVALELSGRHLLKRGMEESLGVLPILHKDERQLVLALAPEEPFPEELMPLNWKRAVRFDLPCRLLKGSLDHDLILWSEWGVIQMAFYRNQQPVWFSNTRSNDLATLINRMSLRLLAEGVLEDLPKRILIDGLEPEVAAACHFSLQQGLPLAQIFQNGIDVIPPLLRDAPFDLPPSEARKWRQLSLKRHKQLSLAIVGIIVYLLLLLWGAGDLFIKQSALKRLLKEIAKVEQPALSAQQDSSLWRALRPVIDPNTYALDLLAAAAAPTEGGKARLTLFSIEQGHLHLTGEATDVTQAYGVMEQIKKNTLLQEYDWNSGQPQLAGKNSVKFDMEGSRPDATHEAHSQ